MYFCLCCVIVELSKESDRENRRNDIDDEKLLFWITCVTGKKLKNMRP